VCAATEWAAVGTGAHGTAWGPQGWSLIAALGVVSVLVIIAGVLVGQVVRSSGAGSWRHAEGPDWVDDWMAVGRRLAGQAVIIGGLLEFVERRVVDGRWGVRRHPLGAAAVVAICSGLAIAVAQAVGEHWPAGLAAAQGIVLFAVIAAGGLLAFLATAGSYLHLVRRPPARPAPARLAVVHATVAAAASVPVTVAFRFLAGPVTESLTGLAGAIAVVAALVWVTVLVAHPARHRRHKQR
jgi:hypothetical protein